MPRLPLDLTVLRDRLAGELTSRGAAAVGVARADGMGRLVGDLAGPAPAGLEYLRRTRFVRQDVRRLWPEVSSVVCVAFPYRLEEVAPRVDGRGSELRPMGVVASYARGPDYHRTVPRVLGEAVRAVQAWMGLRFAHHETADALPVAERGLAASCGVGWVGRSGLLVVPGVGPSVVLGELPGGSPLPPDGPLTDLGCGPCRACIHACPTGALGPRGLRWDRCISYWTTQHSGVIPGALALRFGGRFFGCDACIAACPHVRDGGVAVLDGGNGAPDLVDLRWVLEASSRELRRFFSATALSYLRPDELRRNALAAVASLPGLARERRIAFLRKAAAGSRPLVRDQAGELLAALEAPRRPS